MKLGVVIASTRPGRAGKPIGDWFAKAAQAHGKFEVQMLDLSEINLPMFNEPNHPRLKKYEQEHTKKWSAMVEGVDAFVFVTPEYNFSSPPALVNALNYLFGEWAYKPAGFVSYGGISGGLRGVQMTKLILTSLRMMPIPDAVTIPLFSQHLDQSSGSFSAPETAEKSARAMLDELLRWAEALRPLRG